MGRIERHALHLELRLIGSRPIERREIDDDSERFWKEEHFRLNWTVEVEADPQPGVDAADAQPLHQPRLLKDGRTRILGAEQLEGELMQRGVRSLLRTDPKLHGTR